ncbi:MAG: fumarylacetoacetate hydrolase family protein [Arenimonas sp.]|jgi:2-oxo-3-hexenedioate decarboxylase|nr:fumarylacetoacetate hydrolase family protein [Arenimonas sp.]
MDAARVAAVAAEIHAAQAAAALLAPFTGREPGFDVDAAYEVAAQLHALRVAAGAQPRGRKIGFTNTRIWPLYGVHQPVWGRVYAHTLHRAAGGQARLSLAGFAQPRIEPEIVFRLHAAPAAGADLAGLAACIDWVAPGFEIVQSHFPDWKFQAADTIADGGLHGALVVGEPVPLAALGADPAAVLSNLSLELACDGRSIEQGHGTHVLGGPLQALLHLVQVLAAQGPAAALQAGEVVTTGTLTDAWPVQAGQQWRSRITGAPLAPLALAFEA